MLLKKRLVKKNQKISLILNINVFNINYNIIYINGK